VALKVMDGLLPIIRRVRRPLVPVDGVAVVATPEPVPGQRRQKNEGQKNEVAVVGTPEPVPGRAVPTENEGSSGLKTHSTGEPGRPGPVEAVGPAKAGTPNGEAAVVERKGKGSGMKKVLAVMAVLVGLVKRGQTVFVS
jgi:hypothetical protein